MHIIGGAIWNRTDSTAEDFDKWKYDLFSLGRTDSTAEDFDKWIGEGQRILEEEVTAEQGQDAKDVVIADPQP